MELMGEINSLPSEDAVQKVIHYLEDPDFILEDTLTFLINLNCIFELLQVPIFYDLMAIRNEKERLLLPEFLVPCFIKNSSLPTTIQLGFSMFWSHFDEFHVIYVFQQIIKGDIAVNLFVGFLSFLDIAENPTPLLDQCVDILHSSKHFYCLKMIDSLLRFPEISSCDIFIEEALLFFGNLALHLGQPSKDSLQYYSIMCSTIGKIPRTLSTIYIDLVKSLLEMEMDVEIPSFGEIIQIAFECPEFEAIVITNFKEIMIYLTESDFIAPEFGVIILDWAIRMECVTETMEIVFELWKENSDSMLLGNLLADYEDLCGMQ